jgi:ubiquinone/menaquinone biosynthesis C-methylase UbiE
VINYLNRFMYPAAGDVGREDSRLDKNRIKKIKAAYDRAAELYAEKCFFELYDKPLDKKLYDLFFERTVNRGPVLEIGCGPGEISNYLKMKGLAIGGIDLSEKMIETARRLNPNINFDTGDVFRLKAASGSLAGIVAPYLIVNFAREEVPAALAEMNRALMSGGVLLLAFHAGNTEFIAEDFFIPGNSVPYTLFEPNMIAEQLAAAGFTVTENIIRLPYEGEKTTRAYLFAKKSNFKTIHNRKRL